MRSTVLNGCPVTGALVIRADSPAAPLSLSAGVASAGSSAVGPSAANADAARAAIEAPRRRERTRFMRVSLRGTLHRERRQGKGRTRRPDQHVGRRKCRCSERLPRSRIVMACIGVCNGTRADGMRRLCDSRLVPLPAARSFTGHFERVQEKRLSKAVARAAPRRYTASSDPAEFNRKVKGRFITYGTEPPLENPEGLKRHQGRLNAAGITNSYIYLSPGATHEWQTWRRSFYTFAQLLFR